MVVDDDDGNDEGACCSDEPPMKRIRRDDDGNDEGASCSHEEPTTISHEWKQMGMTCWMQNKRDDEDNTIESKLCFLLYVF